MKNGWNYSALTTSKYHNQRTKIDGKNFASKKEANRYIELKILERSKEITNLKCQVPFTIIEKSDHGKAIKYIADFTYNDRYGHFVIEDTKGFKTDVYKLKKRLMAEKGLIITEL